MRLRALQFTNRAATPCMKQLSAEWTDYLTQRTNCRRLGVGMMRRGRLARDALRTASHRSPWDPDHDVGAFGVKVVLIRLHRSHAAALQELMRTPVGIQRRDDAILLLVHASRRQPLARDRTQRGAACQDRHHHALAAARIRGNWVARTTSVMPSATCSTSASLPKKPPCGRNTSQRRNWSRRVRQDFASMPTVPRRSLAARPHDARLRRAAGQSRRSVLHWPNAYW